MTNTPSMIIFGLVVQGVIIGLAAGGIGLAITNHTSRTVKPMVPQKLYTAIHDKLMACDGLVDDLEALVVMGREPSAEDTRQLVKLVRSLRVNGPVGLEGPEGWCEVFIASKGTSRYKACVWNLSREP